MAVMRVLACSSLLLVLCACGEKPAPVVASGSPVVWTASWPLWSMAHRIGGELIRLQSALPVETDVEGYEPPRETVLALAKADLVLLNGAGLEAWTTRAGLPLGRVVDASHGFAGEFVQFPHAITHTHGPGGAHTHQGTNPHVWLDPTFAEQEARAVHAGLLALLPAHRAELDAALGTLVTELHAIDQDLRTVKFSDGEVLVTSHPTWAYLVRRYQWPVIDTNLHPNEAPDPVAIAALAEACKGKRVRAVLFEEAPIPAVSEAIRTAVSAPCVTFDPDVRRGKDGAARDTFTLLRAGVDALRKALQ
ncbi:MAG: metal ABC transporter substrate-binding protein [Planctomycetota bacterium]